MKISIARFRLQYGLYLLVSLLALSACNTKEDPIDFDKITRGPLEQDTDIPFHLSMPLEEDPSTSRGLPMLGQKPNSPEYAPIRDWEHIDWYTPDNGSNPNSPHILVAISNARQTSPQGGAHEYFRKLLPSEYKIKINDVTKRPHIVIESHAKFKKGTLVDQYDVSVLVVDKDFANCDQFETTGKINFNTGDEFYDISSTGSLPKQFNSLAFVMNPVKIKPHIGKTGTAGRDIHRPFKLLSTILVMEFADPTNKAANNQVKFETNGFTNQGVLSMAAARNPQSAASVVETPAPAPLTKTFTESENLLGRNAAQEGRYTRIVAMALPTKKAGEAYSIKATYTENKGTAGTQPKVRGYGLDGNLKNSMSYAGKMLFADFMIEDAPLEPAKFFQTRWNSGPEGRIMFFAMGIHPRSDKKIASTHKAKAYYRLTGTNEPWVAVKIKDAPKLGINQIGYVEFPDDNYSRVTINDLQPDKEYDVWIQNLGLFSTVKLAMDAGGAEECPNLLEVQNWGTSNEWGNYFHKNKGWAPLIQEDMKGLVLARAINMEVTASDIPNFKHLDRTDQMFFGASKFTGTRTPINKWNVSTITNMSEMFSEARIFNADISDWDITNVRLFIGMFNTAKSFNKSLDKWKNKIGTGSLIADQSVNMAKMFYDAESFNGNIQNWDTSRVSDMSLMFGLTRSFNQDLSRWNVSQTNIGGMFDGAVAFNQNLGSWIPKNGSWLGNLFNGSGMSLENILATLAGWKQKTEENSNLIRDINFQSIIGNRTFDGRESNGRVRELLNWFIRERNWKEQTSW